MLVKVLLCEDEATLPIKSDVAPYYHWKDFKEYCLKKLDEAKKVKKKKDKKKPLNKKGLKQRCFSSFFIIALKAILYPCRLL